MNIEIRFPSEKDMKYLSEHMRGQDVAEVTASHGTNMHYIIKSCVRRSNDAWALLVDKKLMFIAGIGEVSLLGGVGAPWLLGTDLITQHPKIFLRYTRELISEVMQTHNCLANYVDVRNSAAIRYLKHMGFRFGEAVPYGLMQLPFYPFEMIKGE